MVVISVYTYDVKIIYKSGGKVVFFGGSMEPPPPYALTEGRGTFMQLNGKHVLHAQ